MPITKSEKIADFIKSEKIDFVSVGKLKTALTENEIIAKVGGADKTNGSCASLALAYIGNKYGFDVTDFRGGNSQNLFSHNDIWKEILKSGGSSITDYNDFVALEKLLPNIKRNKEYILGTGRHTTIVRKKQKGRGLEYLELQDAYTNGFKPFNKNTLKDRFGCQKSYTRNGKKIKNFSYLIDTEIFNGSIDFAEILGYLNTNSM